MDSCWTNTVTGGSSHWTGWINIPGGANQSPQLGVDGSEVVLGWLAQYKGKRKCKKVFWRREGAAGRGVVSCRNVPATLHWPLHPRHLLARAVADDAVEVKEGQNVCVLAWEQILPVSLQLWMTSLHLSLCDTKSGGSSGTLWALFVVFCYPFFRAWFGSISHIMSVRWCKPSHVCHWCNTKARGRRRTCARAKGQDVSVIKVKLHWLYNFAPL